MANHDLPRKGGAAANGLVTLQGMGGIAAATKWQRTVGWKGSSHQFNANVIERLQLSGLIVAKDIQFAITDAGLKYLGVKRDLGDEQPGIPAGPRYAPSPSPLSRVPRGRSRSPMVIREGAFDYRDHPSRIGDERLAYKGPGSFASADNQFSRSERVA